jgi:hypothetical protein
LEGAAGDRRLICVKLEYQFRGHGRLESCRPNQRGIVSLGISAPSENLRSSTYRNALGSLSFVTSPLTERVRYPREHYGLRHV